ncbi:TRAP transporter small permease [Castellaniella caeni]|uniref:TRAP transporter small permease n=1 Tax=Castellaniella caeni TaxID=266123 RepID=UPI00082D79E2|nr:TRAP transporter small permease [Castellaniella caeni]
MAASSSRKARPEALISAIESLASWFLAAVTALTFVSVILRYVFVWAIPDTFDMIGLFMVILIFWGLAGTSYRAEHICVDLLWTISGRRLRRAMDVFANVVTLAAMLALTWMVAVKVMDTRADNILTFDLHQPVWIYYLVAWLGLVATSLLTALRAYNLIVHPDRVVSAAHAAVE